MVLVASFEHYEGGQFNGQKVCCRILYDANAFIIKVTVRCLMEVVVHWDFLWLSLDKTKL